MMEQTEFAVLRDKINKKVKIKNMQKINLKKIQNKI